MVNSEVDREVREAGAAQGLAYRLFQLALHYLWIMGTTAFVLGILGRFSDSIPKKLENGPLLWLFSMTYLASAFYALNFLVWKVVRSRWLKVVWWGLWILLGLVILPAVISRLGQYYGHGLRHETHEPASLHPPAREGHRGSSLEG